MPAWHVAVFTGRGREGKPYGDRRQMLVYIGQDLDKDAMQEELRKCLLDDRELAMGAEVSSVDGNGPDRAGPSKCLGACPEVL